MHKDAYIQMYACMKKMTTMSYESYPIVQLNQMERQAFRKLPLEKVLFSSLE